MITNKMLLDIKPKIHATDKYLLKTKQTTYKIDDMWPSFLNKCYMFMVFKDPKEVH